MSLSIIARAGQRAQLFEAVAASATNQPQEPKSSVEPVSSFVLSPDGAKMFAASPDAVEIYSTAEPMTKVGSLPEPGVILMALSPGGAYLVTCQKPSKPAPGEEAPKNLKVWDVASLSQVFGYTLRTVSKDAWPALSWASDDSRFAVSMPNAAHVFDRANSFKTFTKIAIKGLASLALCPTSVYGQLLAGFVPEVKGSPASAGLYPADGPGEPAPKIKKAFFRTQGARLMWNAPGTALLVTSFADFDVTNQSYYGEQKLHYLPADPAKADAVCTVALPKEGPVHDVQWSPAGDFFLTVAGFMPSKATLWDANCKPIFDFGSGPYSMVRWNPFSRFIAIAGFGNLPGDILFFDKLASGTCKQMGATRIPAVSAEWSPDGRHLLIATTAPRLRVDNKAQVLSYTGQLLNTVPFEVLFEAAWLPAPAGTYAHRPPSPERIREASSALASPPGQGRAATLAAKAAGYVPPHLRGKDGQAIASLEAPQFSLGFDASDKGGRIPKGGPGVASASAAAAPRRPAVPGAEFLEPPKKSGKGKAGGKGASGGGGEGGQAKKAEAKTPAAVSTPAQPAAASTSEPAGGGAGEELDPGKRLRALQKKLRQVLQLKEKMAKEGEAALEPEQRLKVQGEAALLEEIKALGGSA